MDTGFDPSSSGLTTAICGVSRASLFTGQWMSRHGNPAFAAFKTPWAETYPGLLRTNGYFHAEHGLADKWYPHEESIRVPLIVLDPRMARAKRGQTNDDFTLNVDLAPTILAAAGVPAPPHMQGRDVAPLYLAGQKPAWRTEYFYEHASLACVVGTGCGGSSQAQHRLHLG